MGTYGTPTLKMTKCLDYLHKQNNNTYHENFLGRITLLSVAPSLDIGWMAHDSPHHVLSFPQLQRQSC